MLKEIGSGFSLRGIQKIIYHEEDDDDLMKIIAMFDLGNVMELDNVIELVTDAWNYFPHKVLGGISPKETFL